MSTTAMPPVQVRDRVAGEVRAWLARRGLSARQAALKLGWTQPYISRRIQGIVPFDVGDLQRLGDLLEVSPAAFLDDPDGPSGHGFRTGYFSALLRIFRFLYIAPCEQAS